MRSRVLALATAVLPMAAWQAHAQQGTLLADTAVSSSHPSTNYGGLSNLYVNSGSTALLRFDLGSVPAGITAAQISRATLRLYVNRVNTPGVITVTAVNNAWAESGRHLSDDPHPRQCPRSGGGDGRGPVRDL